MGICRQVGARGLQGLSGPGDEGKAARPYQAVAEVGEALVLARLPGPEHRGTPEQPVEPRTYLVPSKKPLQSSVLLDVDLDRTVDHGNHVGAPRNEDGERWPRRRLRIGEASRHGGKEPGRALGSQARREELPGVLVAVGDPDDRAGQPVEPTTGPGRRHEASQ